MKLLRLLSRFAALAAVMVGLLLPGQLAAQSGTGTVRGQVKDPSGAVVAQATVTLRSPSGETQIRHTNRQGTYEFRNVAPGVYRVAITATGFAVFAQPEVQVAAGKASTVDASLSLQVEQAAVTVTDEGAKVDTRPENNASATVIQGKALEALSDDPDDLQTELTALAGPTAGSGGAQIYIDGFTGGQLPPKSAIREIRINQDPFSAEYDKLGYGRIEILTKPGSDQLHGGFTADLNTAALNARNPFVFNEPSYHRLFYDGNVGGSFNKKTSFFVEAFRRNIDENSIINATVLDSNFQQTSLTEAIHTPRTFTHVSPRLDYQITQNNTVTLRYSFFRANNTNQGIGQTSLPSLAANGANYENSLQISDTQILGVNAVDDTRFEYERGHNSQNPLNTTPTISVPGSFTDGGSSAGTSIGDSSHYELQNYLSTTMGKHTPKFGVRIREDREATSSTAGYNGQFTFNSLTAYALTMQGLQQGLTPEQIRANGGGASQFSLTTGTPLAKVSMMDVGLYADDTWQARQNLTLSYGIRFESQNGMPDHFDVAPRLGFAWGVRKGTVLRGGYGWFYDRFGEGNVLQAERMNGVVQQVYKVVNPDFYPTVPDPATLVGGQTSPTLYRVSPVMQAPLIMQGGIGLEQQVSRIATVSVTYLNSRGIHQELLRNINAPLPGTFDPAVPGSGVRPLGGTENIYQYEPDGIFKQNQIIANFNVRAGSRVMLFGFYTYNDAKSDTSGSFPTNSYDWGADWGRASFDTKQRFVVGGRIAMPYGFSLSPFIVANSGAPFNITLGKDLNGDSIFNDRPAFATDLSRPSVVQTPYGNFDTNPIAGEPLVPINYGTGPGEFSTNLALSKTIGFGPEKQGRGGFGGGGGRGPRGGGLGPRGLSGGGGRGGFGFGGGNNRKYQVTFMVRARNLFNSVNYAAPVGVVGSPRFGQYTALAGGFFSSASSNRSLDLQIRFSF